MIHIDREQEKIKMNKERELKIPVRPFQGAPKTYDCTSDTAFEHRW